MTDFLTNADHWRRRAELTRALAATAVKDQGRLLKVAEEYDRLAAHAEERGELGLRQFERVHHSLERVLLVRMVEVEADAA